MRIIEWFQRRQWRRRFQRDLGYFLRKRYGKKNYYTIPQVTQTIRLRNWDCPAHYHCMAYALYCNRYDFDAYHRETGQECSYDEMRDLATVGLAIGATEFTAIDIMDATPTSSFDGGGDAGGGGYDGGGGFDGGGGGID